MRRWLLVVIMMALPATVWAQAPEPPTGLITGKYWLVVTKSGSGSGTVSGGGIDCGSDCNEALLPDTSVTLTATSSINSIFSGWGGACAGTDTCVVTMSQTRSVTATFSITSAGGSCTKGADCYCDRVQGGDLNDTALLWCEDFEAPTLVPAIGQEAVAFGNGAPYYGPPYDHSDAEFTNNRGSNQYWYRVYNLAVSGSHIPFLTPASPTFGVTCGANQSQYSNNCWGHCFWDATDRWQCNAFARKAIFSSSSDFSAEVGTISPPTSAANGGSGVFDGRNSLAFRITTDTNGGNGGRDFASPVREMGITLAMAFPNNVQTSGAMSGPWKGHEFSSTMPDGRGADHGLLFFHDTGKDATFPFYGFFFSTPIDPDTNGDGFLEWGSATDAACEAKKAVMTLGVGSLSNFDCNGNGITWTGANYNQATHWPFGAWGCVRAYYQNMGLSNMSWWIKFTGPDGVERTVVDVINFDGSILGLSPAGIRSWFYNAYNNNAAANTQTSFRYEDNFHIRQGVPVSCAQIGYGS